MSQYTTICHFDGNTRHLRMQQGEDLEIVMGELKRYFSFPFAHAIIICLEPVETRGFAGIITKVPLTHVPKDLYLYAIPEKEFQVSFTRVLVQDNSMDYPQLELVIDTYKTLYELDAIFKVMKGYPQTLDVAYGDVDKNTFVELPLSAMISDLQRETVDLVAKIKQATVTFLYNDQIVGKIHAPLKEFQHSAAWLVQKYLSSVVQIGPVSSRRAYFQQNKQRRAEDWILCPEFQSRVLVIIEDRANGSVFNDQTMIQDLSMVQLNNQYKPQSKYQTQSELHSALNFSSKLYYNSRFALLFKDFKRKIKKSFEIQDPEAQNTRIRELVGQHMRACLDF